MFAESSGLNANVLVLNRLYMAIRVVSARRAFSLLSRDLAEVVSPATNGGYTSYDFDSWTELSCYRELFTPDYDWVKTVRMHIAVPKIIRLLGYDRLPKQTVKLNRRNIYARDENRCQFCGSKFPTSELTLDHVLPRSQGGISSWENLVCACVACNSRKGGRTPTQAHMKLIRKPVRPRRNPVISLRMGQDKYACWQAFLDNAYWSVELK
jgi:5-methylcytosine-specific restriction endonuclease McrA